MFDGNSIRKNTSVERRRVSGEVVGVGLGANFNHTQPGSVLSALFNIISRVCSFSYRS